MIRSWIYDALILGFTARWCAQILERVPEGTTLLDVGVGTAGALLKNAGLVRQKRMRVTGIDIDPGYIACAQQRLRKSGLQDHVTALQESVYDHRGGPYDAVYFSGSLMVLPEPEAALRHCASLLRPDGRIYLAQTLETQPNRWMEYIKPRLKWLTSIEFGGVTYVEDFKAQIRAAGLELDELVILARHGNRASCLAVTCPAWPTSVQPRNAAAPVVAPPTPGPAPMPGDSQDRLRAAVPDVHGRSPD